jgi:pimeloyl-ACP methyl ester carboxylesterase
MGLTVLLTTVAGLVLAGGLYQAIGTVRDRRRFTPPGVLTPVGAHHLHCRCEGVGAPAVLLEAGIAASSLTWSRVQPAIARETRVCSYDRAGLAWSEPASSARSMDALVSELRMLLKSASGAPPYVLVAHSFGALIIRAFARAHPAEVAGLVFVDPLHPEEWCDPSPSQQQMIRGGVFLSRVGGVLARLGVVRLSLALLTGGAPSAPRQLSRMFGRRAAALLEHLVDEVQKLPPEVLPSVQAHWSHPKAFRAMWQHLAAMPSCSAHLARDIDSFADIPVVVISAGSRAPRWLAADAALAGSSSHGRHIVSPRSGHWIHLDDPGLVIQAIREVIVSVTRIRTARPPCTDPNDRR